MSRQRPGPGRPTPVVVVDDSTTRRAALRAMLEEGGAIAVVGEAWDPGTAVASVRSLQPAVLTMDLEMPGGGGQQAIERIMADHPVPILVLSSHVRGPRSMLALDALGAGALDIFPWPASWDAATAGDLRDRIHLLDGVSVMRHPRGGRQSRPPDAPGASARVSGAIGIAASTGGPPALVTVLSGLVGVTLPILVVQHLHADFMESFVAWMARATSMPVSLAADRARPEPGSVHVAPAGAHLRLQSDGRLRLVAAPAGLHVPSADELFASLAEAAGASGIGVVLTGMGDDGARGLLALRRAGGLTVGQDEETSAVWGMPRAAWHLGAVHQLLPIGEIAPAIRAARALR